MNTAANLPTRLEDLVGGGRIFASDAERQKFAIAGRAPAAIAKPRAAEEVAELVRFAVSEKLAVVCCGSRSKAELGIPPSRYDLAIDLTGLCQIVHYDAADLTLSVDAGLRLSELAGALSAQSQFLPLAVPFAETATIGGTIASGVDSTSRLQYGTARDFLIGAEFVDGTGRLCKSGGRVVKNVTGYDLHKLLIGSLGTLAAITRLNFRTFPVPERRGASVASFRSLENAFQYRSNVLQSGLPLSNLELVDPGFAHLLSGRGASEHFPADAWTVYAAFEGSELVLRRIEKDLQKYASETQAEQSRLLAETTSEHWGRELREAPGWLSQASSSVALIRVAGLSLAPSAASELLGLSRPQGLRHALLVHPCNVSWVALFSNREDDAGRAALESRVSACMSYAQSKQAGATLLYASTWLKERCLVWGSPRPDFPLMQRLKHAFDPHSVFAPGRFLGGI
jgi:glycolate oxidase FAD binding subunit